MRHRPDKDQADRTRPEGYPDDGRRLKIATALALPVGPRTVVRSKIEITRWPGFCLLVVFGPFTLHWHWPYNFTTLLPPSPSSPPPIFNDLFYFSLLLLQYVCEEEQLQLPCAMCPPCKRVDDQKGEREGALVTGHWAATVL